MFVARDTDLCIFRGLSSCTIQLSISGKIQRPCPACYSASCKTGSREVTYFGRYVHSPGSNTRTTLMRLTDKYTTTFDVLGTKLSPLWNQHYTSDYDTLRFLNTSGGDSLPAVQAASTTYTSNRNAIHTVPGSAGCTIGHGVRAHYLLDDTLRGHHTGGFVTLHRRARMRKFALALLPV